MVDIRLNEETHVYTVNGGTVVPNVTRILDALGYYEGIPPHVLEHKAEIGKAVHTAAEYLDAGELDWSSVDDEIIGYVSAWQAFKDDAKFKVKKSEQIVYHPKFRYAGKLDRFGLLHGKYPAYLDIKCVAQLLPLTALQTAAYAEADIKDRRKKYKRAAVQLKPDGTYRWKEYTSPTDFNVFLSALNLFNWRNNNAA